VCLELLPFGDLKIGLYLQLIVLASFVTLTSGCGGRSNLTQADTRTSVLTHNFPVERTLESQTTDTAFESTENNSSGNEDDPEVQAHSQAVSQSVAQSAATTSSTHYVHLSWTASPGSIAGYNIYRGATVLGPFAKINSVLEPATNYTDRAVAAGKTYHYVVTSVTGTQESRFSGQVTATVPSP